MDEIIKKVIKRYIFLFLIGIALVSLMNTASAYSKNYDPATKTLTILNGGNTIATLQLLSNTKECGGQFQCEAVVNVTLGVNLPALNYNVRTTKLDKQTIYPIKQLQFFVANKTSLYNTTTYGQVCRTVSNENGTNINQCYYGINGSVMRPALNYSGYYGQALPKGSYTFKVTGQKGSEEEVEWIMGFGDVSLDEWAEWGATSLKVDLGNATTDNNLNNLGNSNPAGFLFTPTENFTLQKMQIFIVETASSGAGNTYAMLYKGNASCTGANFVDIQGSNSSTVSITANGYYNFTWAQNDTNVTAGQCYVIGFKTANSGTNFVRLAEDVGQPTPDIYFVAIGSTMNMIYTPTYNVNGVNLKIYGANEIISGGSPTSISTTLISPTDATLTNLTTATFSANVTFSGGNLTNMTLYLWGGTTKQNLTARTGTFNSTSWVMTGLTEQTYIWNVLSCGTNSTTANCGWGTNRTYTVHTTAPSFNLNSLANVTTLSLPINATLNVTTTDPRIVACWYSTSDSATPIIYTCNTTIGVPFSTGGTKTITVFANDTVGNTNSSTYSVSIFDFNVTQYENADPIAEGSTSIIYLNITSNSFPIADASATLMWNSTALAPTSKVATSSNSYLFTYSFLVNAGMGNSTGKAYYYNWTYNSTYLTTRTTSTATQTAISFAIDDCTTYGVQIANFSLKDEKTNTYLANTTSSLIEIEAIVSSATVSWSYSNSWVNRTSVRLCVPSGILNNTNFSISLTAGFEAGGHVREFWYLDNGTLSLTAPFNSYTPVNISLMDLSSTDSTTFLFEFTDEDGLEVDNAIIHVFRKYIGEGVFREVERAKQDNNGQTHVHLVEEDVIYYFMVTQNGNIIYTSNTYNAKCLASPCELSLSASPSTTNWTVIDNEGGHYAISVDKSARRVTTTFALSSISLVNMTVYKMTNGELAVVNSSTLSASAGSINLFVPVSYGNSTYFVAIWKDGNFIKSQWISLKETARDYFGNDGAIYGGIILLAIVLMAVSEGVLLIIFTVLALIIIGVLQLVDMSWLALISIICAGGIIVFKLIKRRQQA